MVRPIAPKPSFVKRRRAKVRTTEFSQFKYLGSCDGWVRKYDLNRFQRVT